jgi:chloride channel 7
VLLDDSLSYSEQLAGAWGIWISICVMCGFLASLITVLLSPAAAGGGGAECMGYFNGVNYPDVFSIETFIVKFFGLTFSVASVLCIGKEGVIAHMGSCLGIILFYTPFLPFMKYFRNNVDKRLMAAAG